MISCVILAGSFWLAIKDPDPMLIKVDSIHQVSSRYIVTSNRIFQYETLTYDQVYNTLQSCSDKGN